MHHHGFTDTVASQSRPYMNPSPRIITNCNLTSISEARTNAALNPTGVLVAATAAISAPFPTVSPVLSRINSSMVSMCHISAQHSSSSTMSQQSSLAACRPIDFQERTLSDELKRHKRPKIKRHVLSSYDEDILRNHHSLKLTIKRTNQAHKIDATPSESLKQDRYLDVINVNGPSPSLTPVRSTMEYPRTDQQFQNPYHVDASTSTPGCGIITEPDSSRPCEPGTRVVVEGLVWMETTGMLVLNVKWRGKNYTGTLLDASSSDFGPQCADKAVTSALSLLNPRSWLHESGALRTRGIRRFGHHHRNSHSLHSRHRDEGATITTRSVAAARAANVSKPTLSEPSSSTLSDISPTMATSSVTSEAIDKNEQNMLSVYDLDLNTTSASFYSTGVNRGGKRRRRGGSVGRPYRRIAPKFPSGSDVTTQLNDSETPRDEAQEESPTTSFSCLFPNCTQQFPSLLSLRYHISMGHSESNSKPESHTHKHNTTTQSTSQIGHPDTSQQNTSQVHLTPPPKLTRAQSMSNGPSVDGDGCSARQSTSDDRFDEYLGPPRLSRIVSTSDVTARVVNGASPNKRFRSSSPNDEPPAPSPAYSDISDDATIPAEQHTSRSGSSGTPCNDKCGNIFPGTQSILSPLSLITRQTGAIGSPSLSSPGVSFSPGSRLEHPTNLYLPVNLVPTQHLTTATLPSIGVSALGISSEIASSGISPLPLLTSVSTAQAPFIIQTPITFSTVIPLTRLTQSAPYIPGVNSFSGPPAGVQISGTYPSFHHLTPIATDPGAQHRGISSQTQASQSQQTSRKTNRHALHSKSRPCS